MQQVKQGLLGQTCLCSKICPLMTAYYSLMLFMDVFIPFAYFILKHMHSCSNR